MSTIGYAVCATPKGIEVLSNGLFKQLNIDNKLYLDVNNVELGTHQQVVYLERFSSISSSNNFNGILVGLYNFALPIENDRRGSFIGSAIAFTDFQANSSKLKDGLFSLFNQISKITNQDSRIKFRNPSEWNVNLPDNNKDYGIQTNEKLNFHPLKSQFSNHVVQVSNLQAELPVLLNHFMLNNAFHHVQKLYVTADDSLTQSIVNKGIKALPFNAFFNYDESIQYYKNALNTIKQEGIKLKNANSILQNNSSNLEQKIKQLESSCNALNNKETAIKNNIANLQNEEAQSKEQYSKSEKRLEELKKQIRKEEPSNHSNPNSQEVEHYKKLLNNASDVIEKLDSNDRFAYSNNEELINKYHKNIGELKNEKKLKRIVLMSLMIYFLLTLILGLGLFTYKFYKKSKNKKRADSTVIQTPSQDNTATASVTKIDKGILILDALKEIDGNNVPTEKLAAHNQKIKEAFEIINSESLNENNDLYMYILNKEWRFWELINGENDLTEDFINIYNKYVNTKFGITDYLFDDLYDLNKKELFDEEKKKYINKRLKNYFFIDIPIERYKYLEGTKKVSNKSGKSLDDIFNAYIKDVNDIYENIPEQYKNNEIIMFKHFKYVVKSENLNKDVDLDNVQKIFLPFLK